MQYRNKKKISWINTDKNHVYNLTELLIIALDKIVVHMFSNITEDEIESHPYMYIKKDNYETHCELYYRDYVNYLIGGFVSLKK